MRHRLATIFLVCLFLSPAAVALATADFAQRTGLSCEACHVHGASGGALTATGEGFKAAGFEVPAADAGGGGSGFLFFAMGLLHVIGAVVWFGAIVYIHLFIRPRRLTGGLPRPEMILGWTSIAVMAVTGAVLTAHRIRDVAEIWTTTFGIVWLVKVGAFAVMVAVAAVVTTRINRKMKEAAQQGGRGAAGADGKDGRPAHVVFEGNLYDVSASRMWKGGVHVGRHFAGGDLTVAMKDAPHGAEVMTRVPQLGPAPASEQPAPSGHARAFVVLAYGNLFLVALILGCVAWWKWGPPLVSVPAAEDGPAPAAAEAGPIVPEDSRECVECHVEEGILAAQVEEWRQSAHARAGVGCFACHRAEKGEKDAHDHNGRVISTIASPRDCARCHDREAGEFEASRHAMGGEILASLDNLLGDVVEGVPAGIGGCQQCHGSRIETRDDGTIAAAGWPNTGIGRINPDGSRGSCSACHPRHRFSTAVARRPENCGRCHMGPDHPQREIYEESKHGVAFAEAVPRMALDADEWRLGEDYTAAPTCVTCHHGANRQAAFTHDVGVAVAWNLRAPVSERFPDHEQRRARMAGTCGHCHSPGWVDSFFRQLDLAVGLYNDKFARPATGIMERLREAGRLTPAQFDEEIEWTYYLLWHHEGRRARHGAAMMGPDYVQWHGFFEVAERFYLELVPQAEKLLPGVTAPFLDADEHRWLKSGDEEVRQRLRERYQDLYRAAEDG